MKSIAIIISKLNGGGAERNAANLSIILSKYYNVHLIVFDGKNITYPYEGMLHDLKMPPRKNKLLNFYNRVMAVRKIKKEYSIFASISLMDGANLTNVFSKINDKIITSIRINMSEARKKYKIMNYFIMKLIASKSDYIVTVSKDVEDDLVRNFKVTKDKVITIYNSINTLYFNSLYDKFFDNKRYKKNKNFVISTMGRLEYQKGHWHLIRAMKEIIAKYPFVKLDIYGEGGLEQQLKELAKNSGVSQSVSFKGYVKNPHIELVKSDLFVFPSLFEGLGNALLEIMACGIPCIATDCHSGTREIFDDDFVVRERLKSVEYLRYGVLVSVDKSYIFDADAPLTYAEKQLVDSISRFIEDKKLYEYYSKKVIERAADFSYDNISKQWKSIIND